jgi:hypothetical protein
MIEAGYRCAICKTPDPLQIDHIIEWEKMRAHTFENMIVLCANCHARKKNTSDPRHINRASLQRIKSKLMLLNGRYSDLERRILDEFREQLSRHPSRVPSVILPDRLRLLVRFLIKDGYANMQIYRSSMTMKYDDGTIIREDNLKLTLTPRGQKFIADMED